MKGAPDSRAPFSSPPLSFSAEKVARCSLARLIILPWGTGRGRKALTALTALTTPQRNLRKALTALTALTTRLSHKKQRKPPPLPLARWGSGFYSALGCLLETLSVEKPWETTGGILWGRGSIGVPAGWRGMSRSWCRGGGHCRR